MAVVLLNQVMRKGTVEETVDVEVLRYQVVVAFVVLTPIKSLAKSLRKRIHLTIQWLFHFLKLLPRFVVLAPENSSAKLGLNSQAESGCTIDTEDCYSLSSAYYAFAE